MLTSEELREEARRLLTGLFYPNVPLGQMGGSTIYDAVDCIIEAAVMEAVEKMKGHSHDHSHFSPSDTLFR